MSAQGSQLAVIPVEETVSWTWAFGAAERKEQAQGMFRDRLGQRW